MPSPLAFLPFPDFEGLRSHSARAPGSARGSLAVRCWAADVSRLTSAISKMETNAASIGVVLSTMLSLEYHLHMASTQ